MQAEHAILQALELPVYVPRPALPSIQKKDRLLCIEETAAAFSSEHRHQLEKIMHYLQWSADSYTLCYADSLNFYHASCCIIFGSYPSLPEANTSIQTHSLSKMLHEPSCKREVLHALQPLRSL